MQVLSLLLGVSVALGIQAANVQPVGAAPNYDVSNSTTFWFYDDTTPLTYMMYQTQPTGTATSATNTTVNFYSDTWPAGWQVNASVSNYLGFWASCNNKTFTVNYYGGTTQIGTQTQTCDTSGIGGQAFFWTSSQYTFAAGERLRVEFIVPRNMTIYWDGAYWESRIALAGITVPENVVLLIPAVLLLPAVTKGFRQRKVARAWSGLRGMRRGGEMSVSESASAVPAIAMAGAVRRGRAAGGGRRPRLKNGGRSR